MYVELESTSRQPTIKPTENKRLAGICTLCGTHLYEKAAFIAVPIDHLNKLLVLICSKCLSEK